MGADPVLDGSTGGKIGYNSLRNARADTNANNWAFDGSTSIPAGRHHAGLVYAARSPYAGKARILGIQFMAVYQDMVTAVQNANGSCNLTLYQRIIP